MSCSFTAEEPVDWAQTEGMLNIVLKQENGEDVVTVKTEEGTLGVEEKDEDCTVKREEETLGVKEEKERDELVVDVKEEDISIKVEEKEAGCMNKQEGLNLNYPEHPDYAPSIFPHRLESHTAKLIRFGNGRKRELGEPLPPPRKKPPPMIPKTKACPLSEPNEAAQLDLDNVSVEFLGPVAENERARMMVEMVSLKKERDEARKERDEVIRERDEARRERDAARRDRGVRGKLKDKQLSASAVEKNDSACKDMTGLTWAVFLCLHDYLVQFIKKPGKAVACSTRDQLFFCLLKLRQNPSLALLSHVLNIGPSTVQGMFSSWLNLMFAKITFLVQWPDRESISSSVPPEMKATFPRLTTVFSCFEIYIEHSKNLKSRVKSYSNYKKWTTVKYCIACSPAGSITYLSKGQGGRASDFKMVRESGFVSRQYHQPGDQILTNQDFPLKDDFALIGANLLTPPFTHGGKPLKGKDGDVSKIKVNVRTRIERVVGVLKGTFRILDGPLPVKLVTSLRDKMKIGEVAAADKIVNVCAALVNMSEGAFDKKVKKAA
ncbi:hypothetical protein UPYG_G00056070 [Umbra pygmaea]|uniref:DDE Tnp4 domain-containing protein n=1 Tax=Umbra pygmaea TaxID=75934 RepID=A0ABD0XVP2_UMBPY